MQFLKVLSDIIWGRDMALGLTKLDQVLAKQVHR